MAGSPLARCSALHYISAQSRCSLPSRGITQAGRSERSVYLAGPECRATITATPCGSVWEEPGACSDSSASSQSRQLTGRRCIARWRLRSAWTLTLCSPQHPSLEEQCSAVCFSRDLSRRLRPSWPRMCVIPRCASCFCSLVRSPSPVGIGAVPVTSQSNFWPG